MRLCIKYVLGVFALLLILALACESSATTAETAPPISDTESLAPTATTAVPQQPPAATGASEQPAAPTAEPESASEAATDGEERPTLRAGAIWLDSPLDPVLGGWIASQSGMSENLFRLSPADLRPEPWLATGATPTGPLTWEIELRSGVRFHNCAVMAPRL